MKEHYEINFVEIFVIMFHTNISTVIKNKVGKHGWKMKYIH